MSSEALDPATPRLTPSAEMLSRARYADFWRELNPQLSISDNPFRDRPSDYEVSATVAEQAAEQVRVEGYARVAPLVPASETRVLAEAVGRLVDAGFPGPLAIVYDEVWTLLARLAGLLEPIFGSTYSVFPDLWVFHVDDRRENGGWAIHRDDEMSRWSLAEDGRPQLLTLWIPLTDATLDNSCIYLLPTNRDPNYPDNLDCWQIPPGSESHVRALPARAGSVLMWNQFVLHWGSRRSPRARTPRISLAIYAQSKSVDPFRIRTPAEGIMVDDTPTPRLVDCEAELPFERRLSAGGRMVWKYRQMVPYPDPVLAFCRAVDSEAEQDARSRR